MRPTTRSPCPVVHQDQEGGSHWPTCANQTSPQRAKAWITMVTRDKSASFQFIGSSIFHQILPLLTSYEHLESVIFYKSKNLQPVTFLIGMRIRRQMFWGMRIEGFFCFQDVSSKNIRMIVTHLSPFWLSRGCTSLLCISRFARRLSPAANHPGIRIHHMQKCLGIRIHHMNMM